MKKVVGLVSGPSLAKLGTFVVHHCFVPKRRAIKNLIFDTKIKDIKMSFDFVYIDSERPTNVADTFIKIMM